MRSSPPPFSRSISRPIASASASSAVRRVGDKRPGQSLSHGHIDVSAACARVDHESCQLFLATWCRFYPPTCAHADVRRYTYESSEIRQCEWRSCLLFLLSFLLSFFLSVRIVGMLLELKIAYFAEPSYSMASTMSPTFTVKPSASAT